MLYRRFIFLILPAVLAGTAFAQEKRDSTVVLDEVVIVDESASYNAESGASFSFIEAGRLPFRAGEAVADLLEEESFLFLQRAGPTGVATASLRGAGPEHTQVLLDGMRLADPQSGQVDLTTLPASLLESVSIGHGGGSSEEARTALGGTVYLTPVRPDTRASVRFTGTVGAYGRRQAGVALSQPVGSLRTLFALDRSLYEGKFPFHPPAGAAGPGIREGADREGTSIYARVEGTSPVGSWNVSSWLSSTERGVPGPANAPPVQARQSDRSLRIWAGQRASIPKGSIESGVSYTRSELAYALPTPPAASRSLSHGLQLRTKATQVLSDSWWGEAAASVSYETSNLRNGVRQFSGAFRTGATKTTGRVTVHPTVGVEMYQDSQGGRMGWVPGLSASITPRPGSGVSLHASAARVFRAPTFNDRYWLPGGNPDLAAEHGWSLDAGISGRWETRGRSLEAGVTVFGSRLNDKITWRPTLSGSTIQTWSPHNVGIVVGRGIESQLLLRKTVFETCALTLKGIYTWTRIEDRSDPGTRSYRRQLRYVPEHLFKARFSVQYGAYGMDLIMHATGPRYITSDESQVLRANTALSARMRVDFPVFGGLLQLQAAVENATDAALASMRFYPLPPRHGSLALRFQRRLKNINK